MYMNIKLKNVKWDYSTYTQKHNLHVRAYYSWKILFTLKPRALILLKIHSSISIPDSPPTWPCFVTHIYRDECHRQVHTHTIAFIRPVLLSLWCTNSLNRPPSLSATLMFALLLSIISFSASGTNIVKQIQFRHACTHKNPYIYISPMLVTVSDNWHKFSIIWLDTKWRCVNLIVSVTLIYSCWFWPFILLCNHAQQTLKA